MLTLASIWKLLIAIAGAWTAFQAYQAKQASDKTDTIDTEADQAASDLEAAKQPSDFAKAAKEMEDAESGS